VSFDIHDFLVLHQYFLIFIGF